MNTKRHLLVLLAILAVPLAQACAQRGRTVPDAAYFAALEELYDARPDRAVRGFQGELRGGIRTLQARWIDSICYHTMLGESRYRQHAYGPALEQLDAAIDLFLANRDWLQTVRLDPPVREDISLGRRLPAWARPRRGARYVDSPASFLATIGRIDNSQAAQQGGVIQQAQFWQLDAMEVARCIAWAIYRRGELLGPMAVDDPRQRAVNDAVTRGGLAPPSPWSEAWIPVWQGVSSAALGRTQTAVPLLQQGTLLAGQLDYPLTPLALLVRGKAALAAGDASAPELLLEAVLAGVAFEDYLVVTEALRLAHALQLSFDTRPAPWLEPLAAWTTQRRFDETAILCRLAIAESFLEAGNTVEGNQWLGGAFARNRAASRGPLQLEAERLGVIAASRSGAAGEASERLPKLIASKQNLSLMRFRVAYANEQVRTGRLSSRVAVARYAELLADPTDVEFRETPLDCLAALSDPQPLAFDLWFNAAVDRRDDETILRIIDAQSRRRWFAQQPAGGRIASLRKLLESSADPLGDAAIAAKGALLDRRRDYAELMAAADRLRAQLTLDAPGSSVRQGWQETIEQRENLLTAISLSRAATPLVALPTVPEKLDPPLPAGETVIAFRVGEDDTYGVSVVGDAVRSWRVGRTREVRRAIAALLKAIVGSGARQQWTTDQLASEEWREPAAVVAGLLLGGAPADAIAAERFTIVPDGFLWYTPWNALVVGDGTQEPKTLLERGGVVVAPTVGLALRAPRELRPIENTFIASQSALPIEVRDPVVVRATSPVELNARSPVSPAVMKALAGAVVLSIDQRLAIEDPLSASLLAARGGSSTLYDWNRLPQTAPTLALIGGLHTGAEDMPTALRSRKRGDRRAGDEVFHAVCALKAPGVNAAVVTLWPTEGLRERDLLAEMLVGVRSLPPREAWSRSLEIGRTRKLNPQREPRVEAPEEGADPPGATHALWWAGFLLIQ